VNLSLVFDPLFRVPFANGLLLALVLPLLGSYVRLRNEWLAALGLAQVTAAGGVVAILVGFHPLAGALGAAAVAAGVKGRTERAGNDVYAVLLLFGWSAALLGAANSVRGEELSHALLEGQLYFTTWANLGGALALLALVGAAGPWLSRKLLLEHFFPEHMNANGEPAWRIHLAFDLLVALAVALSTESIGVTATFCLVFFPPWVAFRIASGWRRALVLACALALAAYLAAFVLAILLNQPFGPVLVGTLVATGLIRVPFRRRG
jgi:zinc transport system permease protein